MSNPRGGVGRDGGESHIELTIVAAGTSSKEGAEDDDTDADVDDDTAPLVSKLAHFEAAQAKHRALASTLCP